MEEVVIVVAEDLNYVSSFSLFVSMNLARDFRASVVLCFQLCSTAVKFCDNLSVCSSAAGNSCGVL